MSDSLRNIGETYLMIRDSLLNFVDEDTGEIDKATIAMLNGVKERFEEKAQNCALVCLELRDRQEAIQKEIERLQTLLKRAKKGEEWLREYLFKNMIATGYERITGDKTDISFRSSEEVIIDDFDEIPKEYIKEKVFYSSDKIAIKQAIKSGKTILGAHIEKKKNIQIK